MSKSIGTSGSLINDPRARAWAFQILAIVAVAALGWYLFNNTQTNLEHRGITSGFAFLEHSAGFGVSQSLIDYKESDSYGRLFLVGLANTLLVSILGIILATVLGFIIGIARLSPNWLVRKLAAIYIETFRNIPPLLQIFFWYFAVLRLVPGPRQSLSFFDTLFLNNRGLYVPAPVSAEGVVPFLVAIALAVVASIALARWVKVRRDRTGRGFPLLISIIALLIVLPGLAVLIFGAPFHWTVPQLKGFNFQGGWVVIPELFALLVALSVYTAAFIAETVRSGIQSVSHGQTEAANSLGLKPSRTLRLVIIPQSMRVIIPPLTSQYLNLTKNSSLAAGIGYPDMVSLFAGTVLNQTGQAIETIAITMSVYLVISLSISLLMNLYNKRMALRER